nr:MAG: hypothetical protein DIU68_08005 [Chloroflexota bacterium]
MLGKEGRSAADGDGRDTRGWDHPAVRQGAVLPGAPPASPPLLQPAFLGREAQTRTLTATQIADLGAIDLPEEGPLYRRRLRRSLFYDAPARIEQVITPTRRLSPQVTGTIVHRALRWWRFPTEEDDLSDLLRSYAWEAGIIEPEQQEEAVRHARRLLQKLMASELYDWLNAAPVVLREVPFVYDSGRNTVHGVIDVIFQRADGRWCVLDYKTIVLPGRPTSAQIAAHAERYHLRMGIYALATRDQLCRMLGYDIIPEVFLYYIHHGEIVALPESAWQAALSDFDRQISELLGKVP